MLNDFCIVHHIDKYISGPQVEALKFAGDETLLCYRIFCFVHKFGNDLTCPRIFIIKIVVTAQVKVEDAVIVVLQYYEHTSYCYRK